MIPFANTGLRIHTVPTQAFDQQASSSFLLNLMLALAMVHKAGFNFTGKTLIQWYSNKINSSLAGGTTHLESDQYINQEIWTDE